MGKATDYIILLVKNRVKEDGIVVWYDPASDYGPVVEKLEKSGLAVLRFDGSFIRLKRELEPYLEFVGEDGTPKHDCGVPARLLVYLPIERRETDYALIEADCAGAILEPGSTEPACNTRLRGIAEQVFKTISPDQLNQIARKVDEGVYKLDDLDKIKTPDNFQTLTLIYDTTNTDEIMLQFLASADKDGLITEKQALEELRTLFEAAAGLTLETVKNPATLRTLARKELLAADLILQFPGSDFPEALREIPIPSEDVHREKVKELAQFWRDRKDLRDAYKISAEEVEMELHLPSVKMAAELLGSIETFPVIERLLQIYAESLIIDGKVESSGDLATGRKSSFWSIEYPVNGLCWALLELAAGLLLRSGRIRKELKAGSGNLSDLFIGYTGGDDPWALLDTEYRHLERQYENFDLYPGREHEGLEKVMVKCRKAYAETVRLCAEALTFAAERYRLHPNDIPLQILTFSRQISPLMESSGKTAYIMVDSLRYEMGIELSEGLSGDFEVEVLPAVGQLPGITAVGMAALLPGAENGLRADPGKGGKLMVSIGDVPLADRSARIAYLKDKLGIKPAVCKLKELQKPTRQKREEIKNSDFILVTSQEIDIWGESADGDVEVRGYMDEVIDKLRKCVRRLAGLGVTDIVIAADHGHLFGDAMEGGMKMDPPGGETIELHRRVWIGRGGQAGEGYIRLGAGQIGLGGALEYTFPRSLACFKAGGSLTYMHGGISCQEMIVPVVVLKTKEIKSEELDTAAVKLEPARPEVTTRFFSVTATYIQEGFFGSDSIRVKIMVKAGRKEVGRPAMAAYGFEESTGEINLERDRPNPITIMLTEPEGVTDVSIQALDASSLVKLGSVKKLPVSLSI